MARPNKNNCDYFPHDNGMRNHAKVKAIRNKFVNGYAVWVMLLEFLTGSDGNVFEYSEIQFELLSGDFGFSVTEIKDIVDYAVKLEMLFVHEGFVNSDSLDERLKPVYEKRGKSKEQSAKQKRLNGKYVSESAVDTVVSVTEMPQSKVNESKVNESELIEPEIFNFKKSLLALGVEKKIVQDWLAVRRLKKGANTQTAFTAIKNEIEMSGRSANDCIKIAVERSWAGFNHQWLANLNTKNTHAATKILDNTDIQEQIKRF